MVIGRIFAGISRTATSKYAKAIAKNTVPDTGGMNRIGPKRRTYPTRTRTTPYMQPKSKIAKLRTIDRKINTLKTQIKKDKLTLVDRRINSLKTKIEKDKAKLVKSDQKRILNNKLPVKQRPIRTKTKPNYIIDKTKMTGKYPGLEDKKRKVDMEKWENNETMNLVNPNKLKATLRSMVPNKREISERRPSGFEQRQKWVENTTNNVKGATKDGRFRNPLSRKGEQSYDPVMAKKWTGVGLGVAGGGTLAWNQKKNKFPDPIKFG